MLESILNAKLGDDGRVGQDGGGEDKIVNMLEDLASEKTKKRCFVISNWNIREYNSNTYSM